MVGQSATPANRRFVQEASLALERDGKDPIWAPGSLRSEADFLELHVTRLVAELSGVVRRSKGRFLLRRDARRAVADPGAAALYPRLLLTYVRDFNWAYWDGYPALPFLQQSFVFTVYLLTIHGGQWRLATFYEDAFLRAFPKLLEEVPPVSHGTPESLIRGCYSWRVLERFARFMGLVEIRRESNRLLDRPSQVRSTSLLKEAIRFQGTSMTAGSSQARASDPGLSGDGALGEIPIN